jgi:hypothetical protein
MVKFQKNNIAFRIASADAISKFKSTQTHSFIQVARKELQFDEAAKEVILLEFDRFSQWLFRTERMCLVAPEGHVPEYLKVNIIDSFKEEIITIEGVLESYPAVFNKQVVEYTTMIHSYSNQIITDRLLQKLDDTIERSYENVVIIISEYLQHLLVAMHEFNNNVTHQCSKIPFIDIADFCINNTRFDPVYNRANFFKTKCGITSFILKDYMTGDEDYFSEVSNKLRKNNISITQEVKE